MAGLATEGIDGVWTALGIRLTVNNGHCAINFTNDDCRGVWTLLSETDGSATFYQTIPIDPQNHCFDDARIEVFRIASNRRKIFRFDPATGDLRGTNELRCNSCPTVGGWTTQITSSRIVCQNVTPTEQVIIRDHAATWSCEDSGLVVNPGDVIKQIITGTAK